MTGTRSSLESERASKDNDIAQLASTWGRSPEPDHLSNRLRSRLQSDVTCSDAVSADCTYRPPKLLDSSNSCTDLSCGESDVFSDRKQFPAEWSTGPRQGSSRPQTVHSCADAGPGWKPPCELLDTIRYCLSSCTNATLSKSWPTPQPKALF